MTDSLRLIGLAALFAPLVACADSQPVTGNEAWEPITEEPAEAPQAVNEVEEPMANATGNDAAPVGAEAEEMGARRVLMRWAAALERRDWVSARREWGEGGSLSGRTEDEFVAEFDQYSLVDVTIGDGQIEGAAGSLYYRAPVTIKGTMRTGEAYTLEGPVTLRRVNDVPGASPEDLNWHISQSELKLRS